MRRAASIIAVVLMAAPHASVAQRPRTQPQTQTTRPAVALDAAAIRSQAARMAELRALLADPDPNVRLLTIREMARSGDPAQRQMAVDAGLSSAETALQEVALLVLLTGTEQIFIALANPDGSSPVDGSTSLVLAVGTFDPESGRLSGKTWSGQLQGTVFSFASRDGSAGRLVWEAESNEFRGIITSTGRRAKGERKAVWRPR